MHQALSLGALSRARTSEGWTCTRRSPCEGLRAWLEEEYLSEVLLRAMKPKPSKRAPQGGTVELEWGLVVGERRLQSYQLRAQGVSRWTLEGAWEKNALVELEVPPGEGLVLVQNVPGRLVLAAQRLEIARGPERRWTPPPRPSPTEFLVWGEREVSLEELLCWLSPPPGMRLYRQRPAGHLAVDDAELGRPSNPPPTRCSASRLRRTRSSHGSSSRGSYPWANAGTIFRCIGEARTRRAGRGPDGCPGTWVAARY